MPGEFYFMALGGLGVTLAGFAGLIAALAGREGRHSAVAAWRIRNVVSWGFAVMFVGFGTVGLYGLTQDVTLTVRLATIGMVLLGAAINRSAATPGPAWPDDRRRRGAIYLWVAVSAVMLVNVILASVGLLQLLLLFTLTAPTSIFRNAVGEVTGGADSPTNGTEQPQV